ncbi:restriction endonuclease subunit S [Stutzerimonas stutzeri]|uniref:restriction endonuclease subunit S n=1 Tax=Stutzerimonas stutzeri TaxID=316 RepID=UPI00244D3145|nr:restriction endonuclease subunit S [Stutzerimonas stutzeri]MDH0214032.1 restriction endonuclease subunit S [Stutzerimonas stutzeri]MDH0258655.1 restriction endonuclease subunit S [Stutzerimonas stutzeri]MDH0503693.1 restriction endonuclease subunit S [Stutzerimonas stutzeri]
MGSDWPLKPLEDLATEVTVGFVGSMASEYVDDGVPFLRSLNVEPFGINTSDLKFVSTDFHQRIKKSALRPGDVVIVRTGKPGTCAVIPEWLNDANCSDLVIARCGAEIRPRFLCYWINSAAAHHISSHLVGAVQQHFNVGAAKKMLVATPSLFAQDQVISILGSIDDRITLLRETNATLEAIAQALFKSWFVDFEPVRAKAEGRQPEGMDATTAALFPDSFEESELGLVPRGWGVVPFLDACDLQGGAQPPAATFIDEPRDGYVRLLQIRDFSTDAHKTYIPDTGKLKKVTEDDVLIGRYGSASGDKAKDSLGRVCRGLSGSYNVALMKLCPVLVGREYALQLVSDSSFYGYLQGVSSKAVQSGFSKAELGQYKVIMPPSDLAEAFEQFGKAVWERVKANRELAQTLTQLRDTLLPRLISGQLRLPEAESLLENAL